MTLLMLPPQTVTTRERASRVAAALPESCPSWSRRFQTLLDNCRRFLAGQTLRNVVDKSSWF